jgi:hypothetical protein
MTFQYFQDYINDLDSGIFTGKFPFRFGAEFGMKADYGVTGVTSPTNNITPMQNAIAAMKAQGGGLLIIPSGLGGFWFDGDLTFDQCDGITICGYQRAYNLDVDSINRPRFVFTGGPYGVKITNSTSFDLNGILIDGAGVATNPLSIDRLSYSTWNDVGVIRAATLAWKFFESTHVVDAGNKWIVLENCYAEGSPKLMEMAGFDVTSGDFHTSIRNFTGRFSGAGGIELIECDNVTFIDLFLTRDSGSGYGVKWTGGGTSKPNSIYFLHCQASVGGFSIDSDVPYPGVCFGYDMSNGQPFPTLPLGCIFPIFCGGINSAGSLIAEERIDNTFTRDNGSAGKIILDSNNYGIMRWNGVTGNGVLEKLNDTTRGLHRSINPDGSGFLESSQELDTRFSTRSIIKPGTPSGGFQTVTGIYGITGVPSNSDGFDGEWCFSDNGHIYFRSTGAWAVKV